ncbi:uncharacterized protein LOC117497545 [Trematomus bernacchii]|uniref:uncharacterized protein LOC117497543 n=1 Tax=Trematomus bernacchii TaxID=40690 RepID=UPI00146E6F5F|nr:uncharacterized protein LOC117497543 [Trematomus bernacchii]XP_034005405.1 uncharacterized protein LOC117497545 [Trematomus bernacchii]
MSYISELDVSLDAAEEKELKKNYFRKIDVNLNEGAEGNPIYLWYKYGSEAITKVQVSFNTDMTHGLSNAGYQKIAKNLNAGTGGSNLFLWYFKGSGEFDTPIVDISVTTDAANEGEKFASDWERVSCDLNREAKGNWIHLWLKRKEQTYICDLTAADSSMSDIKRFKDGYIRVDEDTNRGAGEANVFIWYRQTADPEKALKDLQVSINKGQYDDYEKQGYQQVDVDLNKGTEDKNVFLWYKKEGSNPIKAIGLLLNEDAVKEYPKARVTVILRNLNQGNKGLAEYLYVYQ